MWFHVHGRQVVWSNTAHPMWSWINQSNESRINLVVVVATLTTSGFVLLASANGHFVPTAMLTSFASHSSPRNDKAPQDRSLRGYETPLRSSYIDELHGRNARVVPGLIVAKPLFGVHGAGNTRHTVTSIRATWRRPFSTLRKSHKPHGLDLESVLASLGEVLTQNREA